MGFEDILLHNNNAYSINPALLSCDYYDFLTGHEQRNGKYTGQFMSQYSWPERFIWELEHYIIPQG